MTDEELIAEGKKVALRVEHDQMRLGQLALEYAPIGEASVKTGTYDRLREYAEAIGCDEGTLRNYRATAHAWKGVEVKGLGYTVLRALNAVPKKAELVAELATSPPKTKSGRWTVDAAVHYAKQRNYWTHAASSNAVTPVDAIERFTAQLASITDEEIAREAKALGVALDNLHKVIVRVRQRMETKEPQQKAA